MIDKIAHIVTFHCVPNYGAVLQTYGLQEYLKTVFKEVRVLDYRPETLLAEYKNINCYSVGAIAMSLWSLFSFLRKKIAFSEFEKRMLLSSIIGRSAEDFTNLNSDYLFLGSDQIWNPNVTRGFDPVFFGDFPMSARPRVISYAASLGKSIFSTSELEQMRLLLRNVDCVSVREKDAQDLLSRELNIVSTVVADPTILAGADVFKELIKEVKYKNYIFVYTLTNNPFTLQVAKKVAKRKALQIVQVNGSRKPLHRPGHMVINDAGPEQFLSLLYHSDFVVTDSFHGTVFSNLFHVPYITIPHKTRGGRMITLLTELGAIDRLTESSDVCNKEINWDNIDSNILRMRIKSIDFINQFLRSNESH